MDLGKHLFTFAVIADTHVNQVEGEASSDFAVNKLSNARNRHVIHEINRMAPAFVLHLGDIVHPTPIHPDYVTAADTFHALARELDCPMYLTPGNHDVGDKPGDWLPVPSVNDEFLRMYRENFGDNYLSFDANGCHFVIVDAQIINSGLACEAEQRQWLEADLAAHAGERIFIGMHYPPFLHQPSEFGHYDNLDEPGRGWLLGLLAQHRVEALFAGHVHNFWYHRYAETDMYLLPSTAFVRLDYSEMFKVEAAPERGRNDAPKLGFFAVDVHEHGHVAHTMRTFGAMLGPGQTLDQGQERLAPIHTRQAKPVPVGIDLRYPWAEEVEVAASGALDEFNRKSARNDYPLMSLWEMGIAQLKVPLADLANPKTLERMKTLKRFGHHFTVYSHGVPQGELRDALVAHGALVSAWELVASRRQWDAGLLDQLAEIKAHASLAGVAVYYSKLQRHDDPGHHGEKARHVIQHGFTIRDRAEIRDLLQGDQARALLAGLLFNVSREQSPADALRDIAALVREQGQRASVTVRLAADSPSVAMEDDSANANRVAETIVAAFAAAAGSSAGGSAVTVFLDTFADVDRGYFPRTGLVDRRFNPRPAGHVVRHLHSVLTGLAVAPSAPASVAGAAVALLRFEAGGQTWLLALPPAPGEVRDLLAPVAELWAANSVKLIHLVDGHIEAARPTLPMRLRGPTLLCALP